MINEQATSASLGILLEVQTLMSHLRLWATSLSLSLSLKWIIVKSCSLSYSVLLQKLTGWFFFLLQLLSLLGSRMTHGPSLPLTLTATLSRTLLNSSTSWPVTVGVLMIFFFTVVLTFMNTQIINISMMWFLKSLDHHLKLQAILPICFFMCVSVCVCSPNCFQFFASPWTVAHQVPLFMEFSRQEYWSGVAISSSQPRDQTSSLVSPALAGRYLPLLSWGACSSSVQIV